MFKNREFRVRMAKIDPVDGAEISESTLHIDPDKALAVAKDLITHAATAAVGVYAARFVMITMHEVIVLAYEKKFR